MSKPRAIQWLEEQTGQHIDYHPESPATQDRHLSIRLPSDLHASLERLAAVEGVKVSHLVREFLVAAVAQREELSNLDSRALVDRLSVELDELRRRLAG
jgi:predicted DNA-binding protein